MGYRLFWIAGDKYTPKGMKLTKNMSNMANHKHTELWNNSTEISKFSGWSIQYNECANLTQ